MSGADLTSAGFDTEGISNKQHKKTGEKEDVGKRLALAALGQHYGKNIEYSGPIYTSMKVEGNKIRLNFHHIGSGLMAKSDERAAGGEKVKGFAIAGEDRKFVWADAQIDGNTIVVSSPEVTVRHASCRRLRRAWHLTLL